MKVFFFSPSCCQILDIRRMQEVFFQLNLEIRSVQEVLFLKPNCCLYQIPIFDSSFSSFNSECIFLDFFKYNQSKVIEPSHRIPCDNWKLIHHKFAYNLFSFSNHHLSFNFRGFFHIKQIIWENVYSQHSQHFIVYSQHSQHFIVYPENSQNFIVYFFFHIILQLIF